MADDRPRILASAEWDHVKIRERDHPQFAHAKLHRHHLPASSSSERIRGPYEPASVLAELDRSVPAPVVSPVVLVAKMRFVENESATWEPTGVLRSAPETRAWE